MPEAAGRASAAAGPAALAAIEPAYWARARHDLCAADPVLARVIHSCGEGFLVSRGEPFVTLARSIVGQQISVKAAQAVWSRFAAAAGTVAPERVARMRTATLRKAGLSIRKAEYLKDLAARFLTGEVDPSRWPALDDEAVIEELVRVRGIGRWTAEMFLMFNLTRPDVLPLDDVGLLRAVALHYLDRERPTRAQAARIAEPWRPWRTVATWYLWRSLDPLPVDY